MEPSQLLQILLPIAAYLLVSIASFWTFAGLFSIRRIRRQRIGTTVLKDECEPVTVLKPLCGVDEQLEANLRTFFEQDYPELELVFGVKGDDKAADVVRALQAQYPDVCARLVVHDSERGLNPKVANLRAMKPFVSSDLVVVSDSNIRVHPGYVRELVETKQGQGAALVTNLIAGDGRSTAGARLDALHLNAEIAAGVAIATIIGRHPVVVGKSMLFRLSTLQELGGLASVAHILAEDYVIGRMFHQAGYRVAVAPTPVTNVCGSVTAKGFFLRHLRWGMIRLRMQPFAFVAEPLIRPWCVAVFVVLLGGPWLAVLGWAIALSTFRDVTQARQLGVQLSVADLGWTALRDLLAFCAWLSAPFRRHIRWRNTRVRVSAGTRLYAAQP